MKNEDLDENIFEEQAKMLEKIKDIALKSNSPILKDHIKDYEFSVKKNLEKVEKSKS